MANITFVYDNILESGTVTVTSEDSDYPAYRLYDRDIGKLFKGDSSPANFYVMISQPGINFCSHAQSVDIVVLTLIYGLTPPDAAQAQSVTLPNLVSIVGFLNAAQAQSADSPDVVHIPV